MDKHANQMDQSSIAGLPHPQLPPHPQPQLPPHPQPQLPPHPQPQLPPHPHPLPQHQHLGPYRPAMYQHAYRPMAPPPPHHGYAPGLVTPSYYPSAPSTVQSQMQGYGYEQQLEQGFMPHAPVGTAEGSSARRAKRRHISMEQGPVQHAPVGAAEGSSGRRAKRRHISMEQGPVQHAQVGTAEGNSHRIFHHEYPDFELVVGKLLYKCPLLHCGKEVRGTSIRRHLRTNKHLNQSAQLPCPYCGKKLSRGDSLTRHIKSCDEAPKNADTVPQGPGAAPATVVVQSTVAVPQASFTFQTAWDPRSELTSGTQQSLFSMEDAISLALASAAPVDAYDDSASSESLDDDNNILESDAVPDHLDDTEDSASGDKALDNLLNSLDWD